ncbi:hypothetical protein ACERII_25570 [Evansella sp. AB-rgal1]|uniref:hypothetical protein n=1 Tax=Evansella sp. AB-rgal1 TaxID=3242696 RepID=UPI00359EDEFB
MAVLAMNEQYILEEEAARKIVSASPVKLKKSNVFHDHNMSDDEAIAHASNILKRRKCK